MKSISKGLVWLAANLQSDLFLLEPSLIGSQTISLSIHSTLNYPGFNSAPNPGF